MKNRDVLPESSDETGQEAIAKLNEPKVEESPKSLNVGNDNVSGPTKLENLYFNKIKDSLRDDPLVKDIPSKNNSFNQCPKMKEPVLKTEEDKKEALKKCPKGQTFKDIAIKVLQENSHEFSKILKMDSQHFSSLVQKVPDKNYNLLFDYDCKITDPKFKESYDNGAKILKTIFKNNLNAFLPLVKGAIRSARLRFKPVYVTKKVVKRPQKMKFKRYPSMKDIKNKRPVYKKRVHIIRPNPNNYDASSNVPVNVVNISRNPSNAQPSKTSNVKTSVSN